MQNFEFYERRFLEMFDLIAELREKIELTDGVFFRKHRYSKEQLFHDPILFKLGARYGTLEYNINSWEQFKDADDGLRTFCKQQLARIENEIDRLIRDIERRKPTGWERIRDFLLGIVRSVIGRIGADVFPLLGRN